MDAGSLRLWKVAVCALRGLCGAVLALGLGACATSAQPLGLGPISLGDTLTLAFSPPLRTTGTVHELCFYLPSGYRVDLDNEELIAASGQRGAISAQLQANSGLLFEFNRVSLLRLNEKDSLCLRSAQVTGPRELVFVKGKVASTLRWTSPGGFWLSAKQG